MFLSPEKIPSWEYLDNRKTDLIQKISKVGLSVRLTEIDDGYKLTIKGLGRKKTWFYKDVLALKMANGKKINLAEHFSEDEYKRYALDFVLDEIEELYRSGYFKNFAGQKRVLNRW